MLFINSAFLLCSSLFHILLQNCFPVDLSFIIFESPVLFVLLDSIPLTFVSTFFRQYLLIYFFRLYCYFHQCLSFCNIFILFGSSAFYLTYQLHFLSQLLYFSFILISHPCFVYLFGFLWGCLFYHQQVFLLHLFSSLILSVGIYFNNLCTSFDGTYTKIGTIQRRLAWSLCKDDTQIRETFHFLKLF